MKLEWKRATSESVCPCSVCQERTNRVLAFKKLEEKNFTSFFFCDDCFEGMRSCPATRPAEG